MTDALQNGESTQQARAQLDNMARECGGKVGQLLAQLAYYRMAQDMAAKTRPELAEAERELEKRRAEERKAAAALAAAPVMMRPERQAEHREALSCVKKLEARVVYLRDVVAFCGAVERPTDRVIDALVRELRGG